MSVVQELLAGNRADFERFILKARQSYTSGRYEEAAAFSQIAGYSAWFRHPGFFHSADLELLLKEIAERSGLGTAVQPPALRSSRSGKRRVLHVLTHASAIGGHTRVAINWIAADRANHHHVALTQQGTQPVPPRLVHTVRNSCGRLVFLDGKGGLIRIARALRRYATNFDLVVLHIDPHDVVPNLAFSANPDRPPLAFVNHADHVFWNGAELCDLYLNLRASAAHLMTERRGIRPEQQNFLTIPLASDRVLPSRNSARTLIGIPDETILVLTVASRYKFRGGSHVDFGTMHRPLIERNANVRFIVIGPSSGDPYWDHLYDLTDGRIAALGPIADTSTYLAAADIYCDSFPMGSCTSLLEAGMAGLPCVSWRPYEKGSESAVLSTDDLAFPSSEVAFVDPGNYLTHFQQLIDSENRSDIGADLKLAIARVHTSEGWLSMLDRAYNQADRLAGCRPHEPQRELPIATTAYDETLALFRGSEPLPPPVFRSLPLRMRLRYLIQRRAGLRQLIAAAIPTSALRAASSAIRKP